MTTQQEIRNFLGLKIEGDISGTNKPIDQRPVEELTPLLEKLLSFDEVDGLRWTQYTPYFNDGDPCTFSVGEPHIRLKADIPTSENDEEVDEDDADWQEGEGGWMYSYGKEFETKIGDLRHTYDHEKGEYTPWTVAPGAPLPDLALAFADVSTAMDSGAFDNVFLSLFGDHCEVTIRKDKDIRVDEYSHD